MKLIIDCGSTKADWAILNGDKIVITFKTDGFNPNYTDKNNISSIILSETSYKNNIQDITEIFFYGTGCGNIENCNLIEEILKSVFPNANIVVTHDIIAACHALFKDKEGIACILGTGSNSCFYDGEKIVSKATSLGYIIGDEGSGCHIGKQLIRDYFYKKMPASLSEKFKNEYDTEIATIIENIYHKSQCSKYLASFSRFAYDNKEECYIKELCSKCFNEFIEHFIFGQKETSKSEIGFVGSIAFYFQDILKECIENQGLKIGRIIKSPIDGLIEYHSRH